jgi:geranylgeranyl diphosphate synthase type I
LGEKGLSVEAVLSALHAFGDTAFTLTRGQHLDMQFEHKNNVTVDQYLEMIQGKTAALLSLSAYLGALVASEDPERSGVFAEFALALGLSFQIHDDILGIWGDPSVTGKSAASDILSRKKSLPVLYGLARSEMLRERYTDTTEFSEADVDGIVMELERVGALAYTRALENEWSARALDALERAEPTAEGAGKLRALVDALFERQS